MKINLGAKFYLWFIIGGGLLVVIYSFGVLIPPQIDKHFFLGFIFFTILALLSDFYEIELSPKAKVSAGDSIYCASVLVGGATIGVPVAVIATIPAEILLRWDLLRKQKFSDYFYRIAFNSSQMVLSVGIASLTYKALGGMYPLNLTQHPEYILPAFGAFVSFTILNTVLVSGIVKLTSDRNFISMISHRLKQLPLQLLSMGVISILIAYLWSLTPWTVLLALVPMSLIHFSLHNYARLRASSAKVIEKMVEMLEKRDPYTGQHSHDVANLTEDVARELKLHEGQIETIRAAAVVHDIGKIAIPESIVNKPGPLTDDEWRLMRTHTVIGADLISNLEMYGPPVVAIVRHEHEHWDGSGYPDGLKGELIPIGARIIAAADVYDALITDRPYRKTQGKPRAYTPEQAIEIMETLKEKTLDPKIADACIAVIRRRIEAEKQKLWSSSGRPSSAS